MHGVSVLKPWSPGATRCAETMASGVRSSEAVDDAFCSAERTTLNLPELNL